MIPEYGCGQSGFYGSLGQAFLYQGFHALSSLFQITTLPTLKQRHREISDQVTLLVRMSSLFQITTLPTQKQRHREISDQVTLLVRKEPELKSITSDSKTYDLYTRDSIRGEQRPIEFSVINGIRQV